MPSEPRDDHGSAPRGGDERFVLVVDFPAKTVAAVDEILSSCQLAPRPLTAAARITRRPNDCGIALVAIADAPCVHSPVLDNVRRLKEHGYTVLCCAGEADRWPLGVQCRLLIAGALEVFDSTSPSFAADLGARVCELRTAEADEKRDTRRLQQQMLDLGIVGSSPEIVAMFRSISSLSAVSDLPVLIVGETGTGKELAARAMHRLDARRRDRPFVPVNCGAISAGLVESELFGHRRGAFTGAEQDRAGLIRAARGGVLFLDEVGDLEPGLQGKLLRVVQERRVLAVGEDHETPVDVRIIAATNRDLEAMVAKHEFRADLFHRLNVLSIRVPALRERPDDVEPLVQHFLGQCVDRQSPRTVAATGDFVDALRRVDMPGNVRQLENVVRRAVATSKRGEQLRLGDLPPELWHELSRTAEANDSPAASSAGAVAEQRPSPVDAVAVLDATSWKLQRALELCEQQLVAAALGASSGNRARAARLLAISPRCIFNKMRKHRLTA